jgi:hypothetical protein
MKNLKSSLNKIKILSLGVALGISISTFTTTFATVKQYILREVGYPIMVNGEEYIDDELPVLGLNGRTYVPLRAFGDILDVEVEWNDELKRVEIGEIIIDDKKEEKVMSEKANIYKDINGDLYIELNSKDTTITIDTIFQYTDLDSLTHLFFNNQMYYRHNIIYDMLNTKGYNLIYNKEGDSYIERKIDDNYTELIQIQPDEIKLINHRLFISQNILNRIN